MLVGFGVVFYYGSSNKNYIFNTELGNKSDSIGEKHETSIISVLISYEHMLVYMCIFF